VISVAKQPKPAVQSNGFEVVDWEIQFPAHQTEGVRYLVAATALAWCRGEQHLTTLAADLPGNGGSARMSCVVHFQTVRWLGFL
jgi:hypothetical protein